MAQELTDGPRRHAIVNAVDGKGVAERVGQGAVELPCGLENVFEYGTATSVNSTTLPGKA